MRRNRAHEELIEGVEAAWNARGEANEKDEQLLVFAEFPNVRQQIIKIQRLLQKIKLMQIKFLFKVKIIVKKG